MQTEGYGVDFPFSEYVAMADVMRKLQGKAMLSINDHPQIRDAFAGFHMESLDLTYTLSGGGSRPSGKSWSSGRETWRPSRWACSSPNS